MADLSGRILLSTRWAQSSDGGFVYNAYCPLDPQTGNRSLVGCVGLMHAQILYYWAEQGYDLTLTLASSDAYTTATRHITITGEADAATGCPAFTEINDQLSPLSVGNDDIAALCYACGVLPHSDYTASATSAQLTLDVYDRAGFASSLVVSNTAHPFFFTVDGSTNILTEAGRQVVRENLQEGLVVAAASATLAHAIVVDGYHDALGTFHLNFGWGAASTKFYSSTYSCTVGTGWYTQEEMNQLGLFALGIDLMPVYDGSAFTVTAAGVYGAGTLYRAVERAAAIRGDAVIDVSPELTGQRIDLSAPLPVCDHRLTVQHLYGDIRFQTSGSGAAMAMRAAALEVEELAADLAVTGSSGTPVALYAGTALAIDSLSGAVAACGASASYALYSDYELDVTLAGGGIFAGNDDAESVFDELRDFAVHDEEPFAASASGTNHYAVYSAGGNDTLTFTGRSAAAGRIHLGGGSNAITIESGSCIHSYISADAGSLNLTLRLTEIVSHPMLRLTDLSRKILWSTTTYYGIDSLREALSGAIVIDASEAAGGTYTLFSGANRARWSDLAFDIGGGVTLSLGGVTQSGDYLLALENGDLTLTVPGAPIPPAPTGPAAEVILTITDPAHAYGGAMGGWKVQSDQTVTWQDLTTLGEGYAYLGLGAAAANKAMPDIYVYNAEAKYIAAYVTDDTGAITGFESVFAGEAALLQVGIADFNADGVSDLLLRTADGFVGYYAAGAFSEVQGLGLEWSVAALGDVDGNGCADVVIAHEAGYVGAYLIGNDGSISWADLGNLDGSTAIVGAGDVNGDGTDDVIVQVGADYYGAWLCEAGAVSGFFGIGTFDATVQDIADYDGNGTADLLLRTAGGMVGAALIIGADTTTWAEYGALGAEWSTKGVGIL